MYIYLACIEIFCFMFPALKALLKSIFPSISPAKPAQETRVSKENRFLFSGAANRVDRKFNRTNIKSENILELNRLD